MEIIKFKTHVKNGVIKIPKKYKSKISRKVKVMIYTEPGEKEQDFIEELLSNPLRVKYFMPFSRETIYNRNL